jgi:hypothetical protein
LLFTLYVALIVSWNQGNTPWWLALGAVGAGLRTWRAVRHVRAYKAWAAEWRAMGASDEAPPLPRPRSYRWVYFILTAFAIGVPASLSSVHDNGESTALVWLWMLSCLLLFVKLCRVMMRRRKQRREVEGLSAPIEWAMGRASSSPSRAVAQKQLPEYVLRVLGTGNTSPQGIPEKQGQPNRNRVAQAG